MLEIVFKSFVFKALLLMLSPVLLVIGAIFGFKFTLYLGKRQLKKLHMGQPLQLANPQIRIPQCNCGVRLRPHQTICRACARLGLIP